MDDRYAAPRANLDQDSSGRPDRVSWFRRRPIPVYFVAFLCLVQIAGVSVAMFDGWNEISKLITTGVVSPIEVFSRLSFPFLFVVSGALLLFMRKAAPFAFSVYLAWGLGKYFGGAKIAPSGYDLILTTAIVVYSWYLYRKGCLK